MASAYFWFVGAMFQMKHHNLRQGTDEGRGHEAELFHDDGGGGIGLGSFVAGRLSKDKVELAWSRWARSAWCVFSLLLAFSFGSAFNTSAYLFLLRLSAAVSSSFLSPLSWQHRSPKEELGKFIAVGNVMAFRRRDRPLRFPVADQSAISTLTLRGLPGAGGHDAGGRGAYNDRGS